MSNCIDIFCPRCGNEDLTKLKNRDSRNWGKLSVFVCDNCGEEFGGPEEKREDEITSLYRRLI